jgi:hypothetical protein
LASQLAPEEANDGPAEPHGIAGKQEQGRGGRKAVQEARWIVSPRRASLSQVRRRIAIRIAARGVPHLYSRRPLGVAWLMRW